MRIIDRTLIYNVFVFDRSLTWSKLYFSNIYNENIFQAQTLYRCHGINHAFFNICFHDFFYTIFFIISSHFPLLKVFVSLSTQVYENSS